MYEGMIAETVTLEGHNGTNINAYFARPMGPGPFPTVVLVHHIPGWDELYKEFTRKFAHHGYIAICPNLFYDFGHGSAEDVAAHARSKGGAYDEHVIADAVAARDYVQSLPSSNGKVGIIGFCSGGRYTLMMACLSSNIDAAVDSAGGHIVHEPTELRPVQPMDMVPDLSCPLLALFGVEDENPTAGQAEQMKALLDEHGKTYEWVMYNNAGHAFFADYRPSYRAAPAQDMWHRVLLFYDRHLRQ
jgi:carboxymethylenebutenolidase